MATTASPQGRKQAIPPEHYAVAFRLYSELGGYGAVAGRLDELGLCSPSRSAVRSLVKGSGCYAGPEVGR